MIVTVILCTYNRARSLGMALESILASALHSHIDWELLAVDNNSRDCTREVIIGVLYASSGAGTVYF